MDRQLELDLADVDERKRTLRVFLRPLELADRHIAVLCLMIAHGERGEANGQATSSLQISKQHAGKLAGISANTFVEGVRDLEATGLMGVLRNTRPWTYVVNWNRVGKLEPPAKPAMESLPIFDDAWSAPVNLGQGARVFVETRKSKTRGNRVPCSRDTDVRTDPDQVPLPWSSQDGISNKELATAVATMNVPMLKHMFREACRKFALESTTPKKMAFLGWCHHVVTSAGINSPMGVLQARMKQKLPTDRLAHAHTEWARAIMSGRPNGRDDAPDMADESKALLPQIRSSEDG